jgi:hypothetical protein
MLFYRPLCALVLLAFSASAADRASAIAQTLDDWHHAASVADEDRYFSHFAPNGIFMGTDATEHWTADAFRTWAHPYFARKAAWTFNGRDRHIDFSPDGNTAWFDELLDTEKMGVCRGSGVLIRAGQSWKIAQYNLSIPIPNALAGNIVKQIAVQPK